MKSELEREQQIFEAALEIADTSERATFLTQACGNNKDLKARVERLVKSATEADQFFEGVQLVQSSENPKPSALSEPEVGDTIGVYSLVEKLGSGGEGVVFAASQQEPVRRTVALKIIKSGAQGDATLTRFFTERQTLALMEHANIARIYDAGVTVAGVPYFVMELVRGVRVTRYCDEALLTVSQRLQVFLKICYAAQYAHQKGIIHRDLKPSNILVDKSQDPPEPKIIDFGIAQTAETAHTPQQAPFIAGTPAYMSPEQITGEQDVDTRADVYSLGVILYELLVGHPPLAPQVAAYKGYASIRGIICNEIPLAPSKRFERLNSNDRDEIAKGRSTSQKRLHRAVEGDLDAIVLKCLEKAPDHRYATVHDLSEDLHRFLNNEPVAARKPTRKYRTEKFVARNKVLVAATTLIFLTLIVGISVTAAALVRERQSRRETEYARQRERNARLRAEAGELQARRFSYATYMYAAEQAFDLNNRDACRDLLSRCIPKSGELDLRNWEWRHLWEATQPDALLTLSSNGASIFAAEFLSDGSVVARNGKLELGFYNEAGVEINRFRANGFGRSLAVDATRRLIAFDDYNKKPVLRFYDITDKKVVDEFPSTSRSICLGMSTDARLLAGICGDGKARIWNRATQGAVAEFETRPLIGWHKGAVAFAPSGDLVAFGHTDGGITVVETKSFGILTNFSCSKEGINALAFSPDGNVMAAASGFTNTEVTVWKPRSAERITSLIGHQSWTSCIAFSPDGEKVATGSGDQTIRLWDCRTWSQLSVLRGHSSEIYSISFSANGDRILTGSKNGELMVWRSDLVRRTDAFTLFPKAISSFGFVDSGKKVLVLQQDGRVVLSGLREPFEIEELDAIGSAGELAVNFDSTFAAVADKRGNLRLLDLNKKQVTKRFLIESGSPKAVQFPPKRNNLLILVDSRKQVTSWHLNSGEKSHPLPLDQNASAFAISPDGAIIACGLDEGTLKLYDAPTGRLLHSTTAHNRLITGISFTMTGQLLTGAEDGLAKIWTVNGLKPIGVLRGHILAVQSVAWSPDAMRIASGSFDKQAVKIWDSVTHQELINLKGSGSFFRNVSFAPNGESLGAVNSDGFLHLWSAPHK